MVTLIGMGSGTPELLTAQGLAALQSADLIIGAKRLLEHLPTGCTENRKALYKPENILSCLSEFPAANAALLYSGDTGFYSGASKLLPMLRPSAFRRGAARHFQRAASLCCHWPPVAGLEARLGPRLCL